MNLPHFRLSGNYRIINFIRLIIKYINNKNIRANHYKCLYNEILINNYEFSNHLSTLQVEKIKKFY